MSKYPIAVIVGSLRKASFNQKLANAIVKLAPAEFSFKQSQNSHGLVDGDQHRRNRDGRRQRGEDACCNQSVKESPKSSLGHDNDSNIGRDYGHR